MIRTSCLDISILGRITTGVKIMNLGEGVKVASFTKVLEDDDASSDEQADDAADGTDLSGEASEESGSEDRNTPEEKSETE